MLQFLRQFLDWFDDDSIPEKSPIKKPSSHLSLERLPDDVLLSVVEFLDNKSYQNGHASLCGVSRGLHGFFASRTRQLTNDPNMIADRLKRELVSVIIPAKQRLRDVSHFFVIAFSVVSYAHCAALIEKVDSAKKSGLSYLSAAPFLSMAFAGISQVHGSESAMNKTLLQQQNQKFSEDVTRKIVIADVAFCVVREFSPSLHHVVARYFAARGRALTGREWVRDVIAMLPKLDQRLAELAAVHKELVQRVSLHA